MILKCNSDITANHLRKQITISCSRIIWWPVRCKLYIWTSDLFLLQIIILYFVFKRNSFFKSFKIILLPNDYIMLLCVENPVYMKRISFITSCYYFVRAYIICMLTINSKSNRWHFTKTKFTSRAFKITQNLAYFSIGATSDENCTDE